MRKSSSILAPHLRVPARHFFVALGSLLAAWPAYAFDKDLLPESRESVVLRAGERNPFGQATKEIVEETMEVPVTENEENGLRAILKRMKVGGVSTQGKSGTLLLGPLILKVGDQLPPLIDNQTETLTVTRISDKEAVLSFTERDSSVEPRQIPISFSMKPQVSSVRYGKVVKMLVPAGKDGRAKLPDLKLEDMEEFLKGAKKIEMQNLADRSFEMMGGQNAPEENTGAQ